MMYDVSEEKSLLFLFCLIIFEYKVEINYFSPIFSFWRLVI